MAVSFFWAFLYPCFRWNLTFYQSLASSWWNYVEFAVSTIAVCALKILEQTQAIYRGTVMLGDEVVGQATVTLPDGPHQSLEVKEPEIILESGLKMVEHAGKIHVFRDVTKRKENACTLLTT
jgi:hypothetical protein